jgi:hypothetical protein
LQDSTFVAKSPSKPSSPVLRTTNEIIYNVLWRFLQLRGFVNEKHELTSWGVALEAAIAALDSADKTEESVFVAMEMLRMGLVNGRDLTNIPGGAEHGSGKKKAFPTGQALRLTDARRTGKNYDQSRFSDCLFRQAEAQAGGIFRATGSTAVVL